MKEQGTGWNTRSGAFNAAFEAALEKQKFELAGDNDKATRRIKYAAVR